IRSLDVLHSLDQSGLERARERTEIAIQSQNGKIEHLRKLNDRIATARNNLQQAIARRDQLSGLHDDTREGLKIAREEHNSVIAAFLGAVSDWRASLIVMKLPFEEGLLTSVTEWCESPQGSSPLSVAIRKVSEEITRFFAEQRPKIEQLLTEQTSELNQLKAEYERVVYGGSAPSFRFNPSTASVRTDRRGAPLWLLCDFVDGIDAASQAGIEVGLEAAGLLDAWLMPSGEFLDSENHDVALIAAA